MPRSSVAQLAVDPQAALLILHGLAEHAGRYRTIASELAACGISTFAFDQRGHGGLLPKTHVDRFDSFVDDTLAALGELRAEQPSVPWFLWGHSMGSAVALQVVARHPQDLNGLIVTSSSLEVFRARRVTPLSPFFRSLSRIAPLTRIPLSLDPAKISSDQAVQRAYKEDPLIPGTATLRLLVEFALACEGLSDAASKIRLPTLVVHGGDDRIAPPSGSQHLYDSLAATDKQLHLLPELRHEVQNEREPERSKFVELIASWIHARRAASGPGDGVTK